MLNATYGKSLVPLHSDNSLERTRDRQRATLIHRRARRPDPPLDDNSMPILKRAIGELTFGEPQSGWRPVGSTPFPPEPVERITIELTLSETEEGFFLQSGSDSARYSGGDSWHPSLDDALSQAHTQFGASPDSWSDVVA